MENKTGCSVQSMIIAGFILMICGMEWYSLLLQIVGSGVITAGVIVWITVASKTK